MTTTTLASVVFDCADPAALAAFYAKATGWRVGSGDADFAVLEGGPVSVAFQRVEGYRGPGWPDDAKHAHLDLKVADVETATKDLAALGATVPEFQPGGGDWTVLLDPEGHPFCVMSS
ncbi:VOC family protein [Nonomuraea phyllanthi]|uniref:VOC family protein n=2 Tax=Nonomuraea phyllanthi TaxID=2219224 RepID=A0A5C4WKR4_9ACTN|nr:VOC family protein [Nonomuraea phyllanthi]KAB8194900.1 VOC family protein [Nonomuraea phyllanthi]QFY08898.1 VOC family protein [Nonomuraea phyllanthi]